jgi:ABC-type sulfate/molybdate transport systems ATPase subunit
MELLQVSGIGRQEEGAFLLHNVSFTQQPFQKIAVAGTTGSGKTTLLKIIAGLVQPHQGSVLFDGERVKGPDEKLLPGHRHIAYLSQHFELLNHYRVKELLEMANQLSDEEAAVISEVCRINHLLQRWTHQLSGGEKQRIALARLLVSAPRLLLLDEPFSNLDAIHKNILKSVIHAIADDLKLTCLLVSHDPADVLSWADEILVLQDGALIQQGTPEDVYKQPVSEYTAALFGKYNLLHPALAKAFSHYADIEMNRINSFVRPEQFRMVKDENGGLKGTVRQVRFMGSRYEMDVSVEGSLLTVYAGSREVDEGSTVFLSLL